MLIIGISSLWMAASAPAFGDLFVRPLLLTQSIGFQEFVGPFRCCVRGKFLKRATRTTAGQCSLSGRAATRAPLTECHSVLRSHVRWEPPSPHGFGLGRLGWRSCDLFPGDGEGPGSSRGERTVTLISKQGSVDRYHLDESPTIGLGFCDGVEQDILQFLLIGNNSRGIAKQTMRR